MSDFRVWQHVILDGTWCSGVIHEIDGGRALVQAQDNAVAHRMFPRQAWYEMERLTPAPVEPIPPGLDGMGKHGYANNH